MEDGDWEEEEEITPQTVEPDHNKIEETKKRVLANPESSAILKKVKTKISTDCSKPGQAQECPFSFAEQNVACLEWGWPDDDFHRDKVIDILKAYIKQLGFTWRIRNVVESNLLPEHHGIGVRIDDFRCCKQFSGVLVKEYQAVYHSGDKEAKKQSEQIGKEMKAVQAGKAVPFKDKEEKKKKKKGGLFGSGKKK